MRTSPPAQRSNKATLLNKKNMLNKIQFSNGYIEIYPNHFYGYNYNTGKGSVFILYTISQVKRKLNLK